MRVIAAAEKRISKRRAWRGSMGDLFGKGMVFVDGDQRRFYARTGRRGRGREGAGGPSEWQGLQSGEQWCGPRLAWGGRKPRRLPGNSEGWAGSGLGAGATPPEALRDKHGWNRLKGKRMWSRINPLPPWSWTSQGGRSWEKRAAQQAEKCPCRKNHSSRACNQLQGVPVKQGYWASYEVWLPCYSAKGVSFGPQMADILVLRFKNFSWILKFLEFPKISNPSVIIFKH